MIQPRSNSAGFTLIELMVSIAIALLLILGVNEVFRISSETAGQGQALSTINRDNRAIQNTLAADMKNIVPVASSASPTADGPCFIINSMLASAFRNAKDKAGAADPANPLHDPVVFANTGGNWNPVLINYRSHRVDRLGFFARGLYARQTISGSSATAFVSPATASEAYIWYGHARLPNPSNVYFDPGDLNPANTSNQVASDFFLCREAILLDPNANLYNANYLRGYGQGVATPLVPLGHGSPSNDNTSPFGGAYVVEDSRYDIAQSSIQQFSAVLSSYSQSYPTSWWYPLLFLNPTQPTNPWRFKADPFLTKPAGYNGAKVTPASMAMASPCLVRGCSQFIVEFAGNFYTKNDKGGVANASTPDKTGQLDFTVEPDPLTGFFTANRHIRWYGFPRDTNGDGIIDYRDVMPLQDILRGAPNAPAAVDFEPLTNPPTNITAQKNTPSAPYTGGLPTPNFDYKTAFTKAGWVNNYTAAWGPTTNMPFPKLIRITVAIDDPNGRLGDAQVFEYVFDLQP